MGNTNGIGLGIGIRVGNGVGVGNGVSNGNNTRLNVSIHTDPTQSIRPAGAKHP
jgi:hypothetical protein